MSLDKKVIKDFVAAVNKKEETKTPTILTGTVHREGGTVSVKIDGSESLTPVSTVINVEDGERVTVIIENHKAMITGNLSSPAARGNEVEDLKEVVADKVSTAELKAITAKVGQIDGDVANFKETTTEKLIAQDANIKKIDGDVANFKETTTEKLTAQDAKIKKIDGDVASFKETTTEKLNANEAHIKKIDGDVASFKETTTEKFKANEASIENLKTGKLSAKDADLKYANIDFSNIGKTAMEYFYAQSGLVKDVKIGDATITGELVGVTISGDLLKGNTVVADKLVIKGSDGLYYKLNTDGMSVEKEQTDYNSLNGQVIRAKSITATKIDVEDLVAFGATIGGFKIGQDSIYSGVKESVGNTTRGIYMDNDGQFVFGDASQYVKFYRVSEGKYKLAIAVEDLFIGSSNVADAISDAKNTADNAASVASSASSAASTANSTANAAKSTAEGASKTASDAKSTADSASQVASNASSVAGAAKTTADNASKAASEANSTASTAKSTADQAKSTADTATKNLTALTAQVREAETTIKKNKEEIELRAKKTEVTEAIDNIDIGGRNLFLGTSRYSAESPFSTTSKSSDNYIISFDNQIIYSNEVFKQGDVIAVQAESNLKWSTSHNDDGSSGKAGFWLYIGRKEQILVGDYTYPLFLGGDGQSTKFRKVLQLQKYGDLTEYYICFRFNTYGNGTDNLTGKLWNLKLERGNKVTDWSPAPEDYYTKTETDASIKVLSDKITQQVSTTDDLGKRMSKVEQDSSSWSVTLETANAAKSAADNAQATASTANSTANSAKSTAESAVSTANQANSTALSAKSTADNAKTDVDNMTVGGRNLLKGSHRTEQTYSYPTSGYQDYGRWITTTALNGDTYTLSFWAKSTVAGDVIRVHFYNPSNIISVKGNQGQVSWASDGQCDFTLSTTLTKYWVTYKIPKGGNSPRNVIIPRMGPSAGVMGKGTITIKWEKVEEGNKATDWSPAPEDVDASISEAAKTATNYMKFDNSGLTVGDLTGNTLRRNVNIDNRSVNIRNGTNALASFSDKLIELGKSSSDASISLLNKQLVIGAEAKTVDGFNFNSATMTGKEGVYISAGDPDIIDDETYTSALSILNDGKQPLIGMTVTKSRAHGFYNFGPTIASLDTESSSGYANVTIKSDETTSQVELRTQGAHGTRVLYNYSHALSYYVDGAIRCEYTGDTPCLWDGALHMNADQVVTLSAPISQQPHGILLVFAAYDPGSGAITNYMTMPCFVPKQAMGYWWWIPVFWENTWQMCTKQLYVTNTQIQGHANNVGVYNKANTDINVNGLYFTLRRVYGV